MKPVEILVVGAGGRGAGYAGFAAEFPERLKIVGVAEPRDWYREDMVKRHNIPPENVFRDWKEAAARPKFADGVIIATQDAMHREPSVAFAGKKYNILLEKPMAPSSEDCKAIVKAAKKSGSIFAVCHVLRYTKYTRALKEIIDSGRIGEIVSMQHLECVGYWHQAHSFVRGNWRNEKESSFMLLAKSCHDLDWIRHIMGVKCEAVSSFGSLKHFRKEQAPKGCSDRCVTCGIEKTCPYSALKIYIGRVERGQTGWPVDVLTTDLTKEGVMKALREGPYGRCVYACDNDVVDNQVVSMRFEGGSTVVFTMTAFNEGGRKTRIFGTKGEIYGDGSKLHIFDFLTDKTEVVDTNIASDNSILSGHGGGDFGIMDSFVTALATGDKSKILSGPDETLESHLMVFAAEKSRLTGKTVKLR
jgi:predicted dehydrogenase